MKRGSDAAITEAVRYQDVQLPINAKVSMQIDENGKASLQYDSDGDGIPNTQVKPTVAVTGAQAADTEPPAITISHTLQGKDTVVTITAADKGVGVGQVHYWFAGTEFQIYTGPIVVDMTQHNTVYAFADDKVANRSGLYTYRLGAADGNNKSIFLPVIQR
jgi:hypothetical protein